MFAKVKNNPILWMQKQLLGNVLDDAWQEGYDKGLSRARHEILQVIRKELERSSLKDFESDELKLGYNVAQGIVLDILGGKR